MVNIWRGQYHEPGEISLCFLEENKWEYSIPISRSKDGMMCVHTRAWVYVCDGHGRGLAVCICRRQRHKEVGTGLNHEFPGAVSYTFREKSKAMKPPIQGFELCLWYLPTSVPAASPGALHVSASSAGKERLAPALTAVWIHRPHNGVHKPQWQQDLGKRTRVKPRNKALGENEDMNKPCINYLKISLSECNQCISGSQVWLRTQLFVFLTTVPDPENKDRTISLSLPLVRLTTPL